MPNITYGPEPKKRVMRLLTVLLCVASGEFEEDNLNIKYHWKEEDSVNPKLTMKTTLRTLELLTLKDKYSDKLTKTQIREALNLLKDFVKILEDNRTQTKGSDDWHFTLKLWSRDKEKNLKRLDEVWESNRPNKSKQLKVSSIAYNLTLEEQLIQSLKEYIKIKCSTVKVLTMTEPVQLDNIYTNIYFSESIKRKQEKTTKELRDNLSDKTRTLSTVTASDLIKRYHQLLIWGSPGSGKTTFLQYLALHAAEELGENLIPIFISLEVFAGKGNELELVEAIKQEFITHILNSEQLVQNLLIQGRCLILLDGLDEVGGSVRNQICRNINTLVEIFPKNRVFLTCRSGASDYTFKYFKEVEIVDFNENQLSLFVKKWFELVQEQKLVKMILCEIEKNSFIKNLTTNPLLLTMLCLVFEDKYEFPRNRYLLTEDAVNILLRQWDASKLIERNSHHKFNLSYKQKVNLLSQIAYEAFNQEPPKYFWHQRELEKLIEDSLEIAPKNLAGDSQEILREIETNHGLLVKPGKDLYSFSHLTFQEYFVAHHVVEIQNTQALNEVIQQHLIKRQWREVFLMIAGRLANTDDFFKLMFRQINLLVVENKVLQDMLIWLDNVTTLHGVKSSSWRAFYLFVDQVFELYSNLQTKIDYHLVQELAVSLREINKERKFIHPRSLLSDFAFDLVDYHAHIVDTKTQEKGFESQNLSPLLKQELPASEQIVTIPQLRTEVRLIDKNSGVICITKPAQENIQSESQQIQSNYSLVQVHHCSEYAEEPGNYINEDLAEFLVFLKESRPDEQAPESDWLDWANRLRSAMRLYLDIGWNDVIFTEDEIKILKDYFYSNILLLKCIKNDSLMNKSLQNKIIDHLLLPSQRIPSELLAI